jgi:hypothetical protein
LSEGDETHTGGWKKIKFWHEVWLGECPLRVKYGRLFNICHQQEWEVSRVLGGGQIHLTFRRNVEAPEWREWEDLESELAEVELTIEEDSLRWALIPPPPWAVYTLVVFTLDIPWG